MVFAVDMLRIGIQYEKFHEFIELNFFLNIVHGYMKYFIRSNDDDDIYAEARVIRDNQGLNIAQRMLNEQ